MKYLALVLVVSAVASAQNPGAQWMRYKTPEQAGWSTARLDSACRASNATSVVLAYRGKIVYAYGDYCRRIKCHSMRKSFLSALYGISVARGDIDTAATLEDLGIDDPAPLTPDEKRARVSDLLTARSGVYLPSGQETSSMKASRPPRGSHLHGTFWYYNNWDFNVLGTIFRNRTHRDIFEAFNEQIAAPLQMEDFRLLDGAYDVDSLYPRYPGYVFKLSARDAARFGELYLQNGTWNGREIVSRDWVERSTSSLAATTASGTSYGYLWWIAEDFRGTKMYCASGTNGQRIAVIPSREIVVAVNVDTYRGRSVRDVDSLVARVAMDSRTEVVSPNPEFVPLEATAGPRVVDLAREERDRFPGRYSIRDTVLTISRTTDGLVVEGVHYSYKFRLLPTGKNTFFVEDINLELAFDVDESGRPVNPRIHEPAGE